MSSTPIKSAAWLRPQQVKAIVAQIEREFGVGLRFIVERLRRALVAEAVLAALRAQDKETITIEQMDWLYEACMRQAGFDPFTPSEPHA